MIKLGPNKFEVPVPGAMRTFALQQRILPVAGNLAGAVLMVLGRAPDFDLEKLVEQDVLEVLPAALPHLGNIFAKMPPGELEALTRELLREASADGVPLFDSNPAGNHFDGLMQGRTMDVWRLLWHALGVWYPDFFALAAQRRAERAQKASPSPV